MATMVKIIMKPMVKLMTMTMMMMLKTFMMMTTRWDADNDDNDDENEDDDDDGPWSIRMKGLEKIRGRAKRGRRI